MKMIIEDSGEQNNITTEDIETYLHREGRTEDQEMEVITLEEVGRLLKLFIAGHRPG